MLKETKLKLVDIEVQGFVTLLERPDQNKIAAGLCSGTQGPELCTHFGCSKGCGE